MEKDTVNKKRDFGQKLQDFMVSYRGKVIMNYAYSWGAAIVIAGTLFKLTHLPGANLMLWIGMGTEMSALNRNLAGINAIYEMQLRSASTQINTIDQVHEQTRKMARQIEELNAVYARMLQAVQVK